MVQVTHHPPLHLHRFCTGPTSLGSPTIACMQDLRKRHTRSRTSRIRLLRKSISRVVLRVSMDKCSRFRMILAGAPEPHLKNNQTKFQSIRRTARAIGSTPYSPIISLVSGRLDTISKRLITVWHLRLLRPTHGRLTAVHSTARKTLCRADRSSKLDHTGISGDGADAPARISTFSTMPSRTSSPANMLEGFAITL